MDEAGRRFEHDAARAALLLRSIAEELLRVPLDVSTRALHLRALAMKREVALWRADSPSCEARKDALKELTALLTDALWWREQLPSGRVIVAARRPDRGRGA